MPRLDGRAFSEGARCCEALNEASRGPCNRANLAGLPHPVFQRTAPPAASLSLLRPQASRARLAITELGRRNSPAPAFAFPAAASSFPASATPAPPLISVCSMAAGGGSPVKLPSAERVLSLRDSVVWSASRFISMEKAFEHAVSVTFLLAGLSFRLLRYLG